MGQDIPVPQTLELIIFQAAFPVLNANTELKFTVIYFIKQLTYCSVK